MFKTARYEVEATYFSHLLIYILLLLNWLLIVNVCVAQQNYSRFYSTNDGLPSSTIASEPTTPIFQDKGGFIWFATFGGASIYDGYHFKNYTAENNGITDDIVFAFFEKSKDETWVVESSCTDVFVKRKKIRTIPLKGYQLSNYLLTHDGRVLAARDGYIFEIRDYKPKRIASFPYEITKMYEAGDYFLIQDAKMDSIYLVDKTFLIIADKQKGHIFEDCYQRYWFFNSQFYLFDTLALKKGSLKSLTAPAPMNQINLPGKQVTDFLPDPDGYYWLILADEKGVTRIDGEGMKKHFNINANSLMEDADGNIWMPGDAGFNKFFNKYNDFYGEAEGLPSERITGIDEDERNGAAWVAYKKGISCIWQNKVYSFTHPENNPSWTSVKIQTDSLWVATGVLYLYKIFYKPQPHFRLLKKWAPVKGTDDFISCMQVDSDGAVFIALQDHGLFRATSDGKVQKLHDAGLCSFFIDGNELWTGGLPDGVSKWKIIREKNNLHLELIQQFQGLPDNYIRCISKDAAGNFWMGTLYKGIIKFERQKDGSFFIRNYFSKQGLTNPWVMKISINRQGEIYASTMGGGIFQVHTENDSVYIENLTERYGGVSATWDYLNDSRNNFWLATPAGIVHVRNDLFRKSPPPKVFFSQLLNNNRPDGSILDQKKKAFSYNENNLAFEFSATTYRNEDKVLYSYQLEKQNHSAQWSSPQAVHAVSLVSLSPGAYTLRVKALTAEKVWTDVPADYSFIINPPYWASWWFRSLALLVTGCLIYLLYRYRINQFKKLLKIRTRISRDLHDEVGSTLSGIGLLSEVAMQQLKNQRKSEAMNSLYKINTNSEEMLEKMSDIVWAINPQNDSFEKVINRLKSYAKTTTDTLGVRLHFILEKDLQRFDMDMQKRSNIYLICKEAINNSIKYSGCRNLRFCLEQQDHHVSITIIDDGKGFNIQQNFEGNGLKNMKSRAEEINAQLNLSSEINKGTSIGLFLKIT